MLIKFVTRLQLSYSAHIYSEPTSRPCKMHYEYKIYCNASVPHILILRFHFYTLLLVCVEHQRIYLGYSKCPICHFQRACFSEQVSFQDFKQDHCDRLIGQRAFDGFKGMLYFCKKGLQMLLIQITLRKFSKVHISFLNLY